MTAVVKKVKRLDRVDFAHQTFMYPLNSAINNRNDHAFAGAAFFAEMRPFHIRIDTRHSDNKTGRHKRCRTCIFLLLCVKAKRGINSDNVFDRFNKAVGSHWC